MSKRGKPRRYIYSIFECSEKDKENLLATVKVDKTDTATRNITEFHMF